MKLSILVPVFNFQVFDFVSELNLQSAACNLECEILCVDDASDPLFKIPNRKVQNLQCVKYLELKENLGRSRIRNFMAKEAIHDSLLFLDCDSMITSPDFIKKYTDPVPSGTVVYGGRSYNPEPPADKNLYLRWYYGCQRESVHADIRQKQPYRYFMTNNFLIAKSTFLAIRLNEGLTGYGHEDTAFAHEMKVKNIPLRHIENPLCHVGLENAADFLEKTRQGVSNLSFMIRKGMVDEDVKLYKYYSKMNNYKMTGIVKFIYRKLNKMIERNLLSGNPDLRYFDLYKLYWLACDIEKFKSEQDAFQ